MTIVLKVQGEKKRLEQLYTKPYPGEYIRLHDGLYQVNHIVVSPNACEVYAERLKDNHPFQTLFAPF